MSDPKIELSFDDFEPASDDFFASERLAELQDTTANIASPPTPARFAAPRAQRDTSALGSGMDAVRVAERGVGGSTQVPRFTEPERNPSRLESFAAGVADTGTFGFADELTGAVQSLLGPNTPSEERRTAAMQLEAHLKANPGATYGGKVLGMIATSSAGAPVKGASMLANMGRAAAPAAVTGFGSSEGDLQRRALDALTSAGLGAGTSAVFQGLPKLSKLVGNKLRSEAKTTALKSSGITLKTLKKLSRGERVDADKVATEAIDFGLMAPGDTAEEVLEKASTLRKSAGAKIGQLSDEVADNPESLISVASLRAKVADLLDNTAAPRGSAKVKSQMRRILADSKTLEHETGAAGMISFSGLRKHADAIGEVAGEPNAPKSVKQMYGALRDSLDDAVEKVGNALGDADKKQALQQLNRQFRVSRLFEDAAENAALKGQLASFAIPTISAAGGGYAAHELGLDPKIGLALGGGATLLARSPRLASRVFSGAARGAEAVTGPLQQMSALAPAVGRVGASLLADDAEFSSAANVDQVVQRFEQSPEAFGDFTPVLKEKAAAGRQSLRTAITALSRRSPKFRAAVKQNAD